MTRAELDARIADLFARQARADEDERDRRIADLEAGTEKMNRRAWARTAELKGPGGDTAYAVLARLGVVDRQGDIVDSGCLLNAPGERVPVSFWNHSYLNDPDSMAAGFATVSQEGGELRARVTFNDLAEGRAAARRVHDQLPDWSWGLSEIQTRPLTASERAAGAVRAVHKVRVIEVSPVSRAASVASGTLAATCASCALAGSGKCAGSGSCATQAGLPPCHPTRRRIGRMLEQLTAQARQSAKDEEQRRDARIASLEADAARLYGYVPAEEARRARYIAQMNAALARGVAA